jgi:hypothetical protein
MTDELTRLFDAERAARPPGGDMERGLGRLLGDVARGVAPLPVAATSLKFGLSLASKWLAVGFVVGIGGAGAASQIWAPNAAAAPSVRPQAVMQPLPVAAPPEPPAPSGAAATVTAPEAATVRAAGRTALSVPSAEPPAAAAHLDEEMRLIASAKRELEAGKRQLASAWLTEHAARFPNGVFASEREALRILLRCGERRDPKLAERFVASHPSSPIAERLLRACSSAAAPSSSAVDFPKSTND